MQSRAWSCGSSPCLVKGLGHQPAAVCVWEGAAAALPMGLILLIVPDGNHELRGPWSILGKDSSLPQPLNPKLGRDGDPSSLERPQQEEPAELVLEALGCGSIGHLHSLPVT